MEAASALSFKSHSWVGSEKCRRKTGGGLRIPQGFGADRRLQSFNLRADADSFRSRNLQNRISCCCSEREAADPQKFNSGVDEALILKRKSEDIIPYLNERCIYLVGMMGSGKTTVGKILSEVLGYSFFDSDKLVEQTVGMYSVAQIFKERSEAFFRDNEVNCLRHSLMKNLRVFIQQDNLFQSKTLRDLSLMRRLVVATGGGVVIRPINWRYMKQGVTVWLDVPLEALAKRIAAVGTESRPLLHNEPGDPYSKALIRLSTLSKERGDAYANADARVCLQHIASKQGHDEVSALTPTAIAIEALIKIERFLTEDATIERLTYS